MRQVDLLSSPTPALPDDPECERDLFGNPI